MEEIIENSTDMEKRTVFMGTPQFAVPVLEALLHDSYEVIAVYTQPDKLVGRGRRVSWSPVKSLAMKHEIPVIQPSTFKSAEVAEELASFKPDLIVVAAFGHILSRELLSSPRFACINVHPSLLPRHRGPSPIASAILSGDELTGVSIMLMDSGMDSGPVLTQEKTGIAPADTTGSLSSKLAELGAKLLLQTLPVWIKGEIEPQAQDEAQATYSKLITGEDGEIDWRLPAIGLWRQIRAYNPWPGSYTWFQGKRLKIHEATPLENLPQAKTGEVIALTELPEVVGVGTGNGVLGLCQVQVEGKREMSVSDFVRGQRNFVGSVLGRS